MKQLVREFYEKHNPTKLDQVDDLLAKFEDRETELLRMLYQKYSVTMVRTPTPHALPHCVVQSHSCCGGTRRGLIRSRCFSVRLISRRMGARRSRC